MDKKQTASNVSSGAEKVETVEKKVKKQPQNTTAKHVEVVTEEKIDVKKMNAQSTNGKAEKESIAAKARVEQALKKQREKAKRAEEKAKAKAKKIAEKEKRTKMTVAQRKAEREKLLAERKARIEKRKAEKKARIEKRKAEKQARIEKRNAEREAKRRERAHAKANRLQEKSRNSAKKQEGKTDKPRRNREKGYGGWLAAVIALGAVTLGLTTAVTVGAIDMKETKAGVIAGHKSTAYEMVGIMENVDNDLDRARISASPVQQSRILTDLLVQVRLAELDLEKLPIEAEADANLTAFINRVARESERMLAKLRRGERLSEGDEAILQRLYEIGHQIRGKLDEFVFNMSDTQIMQ